MDNGIDWEYFQWGIILGMLLVSYVEWIMIILYCLFKY